MKKQLLGIVASLLTSLPYAKFLSRLVDRIIIEIEKDAS